MDWRRIYASTRRKFPNPLFCGIIRCNFDGRVGCWIGNEKGKWNKLAAASASTKAPKLGMCISPLASSAALAETRWSSQAKFYKEVLKDAREKFTQEISFQSKDKDISLAKALLYVASEDEAFMDFNRELDFYSLQNERTSTSLPSDTLDWKCVDAMPLAGKNMSEWMAELDSIAREVEAELVPRDIGCHLVEVLDAVNVVLFKSRGFKRSSVTVDSKCSYLHSVLSSGHCSAILLSVIYIEVCRRLNLTIVGSRIGEEFLIWPQTGNPEELFKVTSGHSLFGIVNGKCVDDPRSMASDINSNSLSELEIATNRDIIGIALANLMRIHWKRASRAIHGLMLASPLRSVDKSDEKFKKTDASTVPLLRPQDLRLAIMASQRLLILQPHNWVLRRDHGMMLYYSREYEEAVQELSICMVFAPEEEAQVLEAFVEKLHLLQLESSWKNLERKGPLRVT
ncbi:transglutaminase-like and tetratricopeptide repeat-containing protein isoform 1 [Solanum lycopersicum]|uniref:transglutaminase-like and tetratricopeptide repeat-containing protein isoform 1 n=1 Tax=Solanum lycopersicum TaxID=4081 RepID=UPI0002BCA539|nr:transglutaminase-like and tetratricopeptide repeat-containing protein isoform 1 [Solanum lycopersicum]